MERFDPELFGPLVIPIIIATVILGKSATLSHTYPTGGLVDGPRMPFGIGERLGQQRLIAKVFAPLMRQHTQSRAENLAGQVGGSGRFGYQKPGVVDDELEPLGAGPSNRVSAYALREAVPFLV